MDLSKLKLKIKELNITPPAFIRNKYTVLILVFFIWVGFIDDNSALVQCRMYYDKKDLQEQIDSCKASIKHDSTALMMLRKDTDEYYRHMAREKYFMKADNEDVFIIDDAD